MANTAASACVCVVFELITQLIAMAIGNSRAIKPMVQRKNKVGHLVTSFYNPKRISLPRKSMQQF